MGDYVRTLDQAIDAVAAILELPSQRERLIQSTIRIMMCVEPEPREFLADSQALLIEGGLDALAARRREMLESLDEDAPIIVLSEEDSAFDAVGTSLDALRLADVAFRVFPELRRGCEAWRAARALRADASSYEELVSQGICRRGGEGYRQAQQKLERLISAEKVSWAGRAQELREACRNFLIAAPGLSDTPVSDGELLFSLFAVDDGRVKELLDAMEQGPDAVASLARRTFDCLTAIRSLQNKAA